MGKQIQDFIQTKALDGKTDSGLGINELIGWKNRFRTAYKPKHWMEKQIQDCV